jgi:Na+-driven multidrug efflux pump
VRATFNVAAAMATGGMFALTLVAYFGGSTMIHLFSTDPAVVRVGEEYLRILSLTFVASGIVFVSSSMFQALGNTVPPLVSSLIRTVLVVAAVLMLARLTGFQLVWVWYIAAGSTGLQLTMNLLLLRREFRVRLAFDPATAPPARL